MHRRHFSGNPRVILILAVSLSLSAFLLSALVRAQSTKPVALIAANRHGTATAQVDEDKPHLLAGSYYSVQGDLNATLMLNNKGPRPLEVRPTLFNLAGERMEVEPITVEGNSFRHIDLREWVTLGGPAFQSGSVQLFHLGRDLVLGAQIYLVDARRSLSFEEKLVELTKFDSTRLDGLWWLPSRQSEVQLVLSNTTDQTLSITAHLASMGQRRSEPQHYTLSAHETRVIDVSQEPSPNEATARSEVGAVSLEHFGRPDALIARAMVRDSGTGYSTTVQFSNPRRGKTSQYHGAGLRLGRIADEELTPVVLARNVGDNATVLSGRVPYSTSKGSTGVVTLPQTRLAPGQIKLVDLRRLMGKKGVPPDIATAGLEFEYTGTPGSVVMSAQSVSSGGNQVFRVPLWDPLAQRSPTGGYPWYIEGDSSTAIYIKNITDHPQHYVGRFIHSGGTYSLGMKSIDAHQTVSIDLRALRDNGVPDYFGEIIPPATARGQFQWSLIQGGEAQEPSDPLENLALIGRSEQVDIERGISSNYACQNCCNDNVRSVGVVPGNTVDSLNTRREFAAIEERIDCYGQIYPVRITNGVTWSSSNTSVATIDSAGWATTQNPGTTTISARWDRTGRMENPDQCVPQLRPSKDGTEVQPLLPACGTCLTFHAVMNVNVGYEVTACDVTIQAETVSPGDGTLPVRNPAQIRRLFAPVFEATVTGGSPAACPVNWLVAGPGSIVGAANNPLLTVNGNALGDLLLKVTTRGGRFADLIVPVVEQRPLIDVRAVIVRRSDGTGAATTEDRVRDHINTANLIWQQCGIQFNLVGILYRDDTTFLTPDAMRRTQLWNLLQGTGGFEVYYVDDFPDTDDLALTNDEGSAITDDANGRTAAHELGHAMNLGHSGTVDLHLMHGEFSVLKADIRRTECNALSRFSSN